MVVVIEYSAFTLHKFNSTVQSICEVFPAKQRHRKIVANE